MRILIVGNGGREHALLWKLARDAPSAEFFITRGNGGTGGLATSLPLGPEEIQALAGWAEKEAVDLTVVGPEGPLADGIVDHFTARGLAIFGPTAAAAEIESSKAFAKDLMRRYGIPTAAYETFSDAGAAEAYIRDHPSALVVKASGLAAGKGAVVCDSTEAAVATARGMLENASLGDAGSRIVVEELMAGEELSIFALSDGERVLTMLPSQDHKRIGDGDTGPNTGGMGAYAPVSIATPAVVARIEREILLPTIAAMTAEGRAFRGLLYAGIMLTSEGPKVVEFNCRFGDPETQVVLPLMADSLLDPVMAIASGRGLSAWEGRAMTWREGAAATTVVAAPGYPGEHEKGAAIGIPPGLEGAEVMIFHAGTRAEGTGLVTSGGRILAVTALAETVAAAAAKSRDVAQRIEIEGAQFRRDIGWREIRRVAAPPAAG